jgi:hypothetical protein
MKECVMCRPLETSDRSFPYSVLDCEARNSAEVEALRYKLGGRWFQTSI